MSNNTMKLDYISVPTGDKEVKLKKPYGWGHRHIQIFIVCIAATACFGARAHFNITMVAMTNQQTVKDHDVHSYINTTKIIDNNSSIYEDINYDMTTKVYYDLGIDNATDIETHSQIKVESSSIRHKTFDWSKSIQEILITSFFVGYVTMMIPMGMVCQRWGGKIPLQIALLVNGIVSLMTPWLASWGGWKAISACRFFQGVSQGGMYPSLQCFNAKWASASERSRFTCYSFSGPTIGIILAFQVGGVLANSSWGWPLNFWVSGIFCLIIFIAVTIYGSASPLDHKSISEEEKKFILGDQSNVKKRAPKLPWKTIMTSKVTLAAMAGHMGSGVVYLFFFNQVPSYVHYILGMNIKNSGLFSSLPYMSNAVISICFGILSDFCTNKGFLSIKNARKIFNSIGTMGMTSCLLLVSFTNSMEMVMFFFTLSMSLHGAVHVGWMVNYIDLSPNNSGFMMALGNLITTICYFTLSTVISVVVKDVTNLIQWRIMFLIVTGIGVLSNIIYVLFITTDTQPWDSYGLETNETEDNEQECNKSIQIEGQEDKL